MKFEYRVLNPNEHLVYRETRLESLLRYPSAFGEKYVDVMKISKLQMERLLQNQ